jgi:HEPN domain-containing protein
LDKYYIPTRYPNAWTEGFPEEYYTKEDAEKSILFAETIMKYIEESWKLLKRGEKSNRGGRQMGLQPPI